MLCATLPDGTQILIPRSALAGATSSRQSKVADVEGVGAEAQERDVTTLNRPGPSKPHAASQYSENKRQYDVPNAPARPVTPSRDSQQPGM